MAKKCSCSDGGCFCAFENSTTVEFSGSGSIDDPFLASAKSLLIVDDTTTLSLDLEISEDQAVLTAQPILGANVQVFTSNGTWNKPAGVQFARVMMIGAGGGGSSGKNATYDATGGYGADAGQVALFTLTGADIPASAAVIIGQGGTGGAPDSSGGFGNSGLSGGDTSFGARVVQGGAGAHFLNILGHASPRGEPPGQFADEAADNPAWYYLAPGAGGRGEGDTDNAQQGGYSHPAMGSRLPGSNGGGAAGGGNGSDELVTKCGSGGGGGAQETAGGNGGLYGGGGGGGGFATPGNMSGAGGNGADGVLVVVSW